MASRMLDGPTMSEFTSLDGCAAYVAARDALDALQEAATTWPEQLAERARQAAVDTLMITAEGIHFQQGSAGRRRCLRDAIASAISMAASIDVARTLGFAGDSLEHTQRLAGRAIALRGMFFHANAAVVPELAAP